MIGDVSKSHVSASVDLACRYKNKEVIAFSSFPPHQTCSVSPIFTRYIQQNKTKESANFLTTNLLLPLYGHFLIQSIPNSGYRVLSSDSQKNIGKGENKPLTVKSFIVTSILDNSLFFLPWHQMCQRHNLNLSQNQLFFPQDRSILKETCRVN